MTEGLFEEPGPELDTGPIDEVDTTIADLVMPVALDPDKMMPPDVATALEEIDALRTLRASAEAREFALVGHVATIAPRPAQSTVTGAEQLVDLGGDGCPQVPEFIALEIAALLHTSHTAARGLIADSLATRWRHPRMWRAVMDVALPLWQARRIAQAVRWAGLDRSAALRVDRALAPALGKISWTRLEALTEGEIVAANPARAAQAEERARTGTFARITRDETGHAGVRTLIARLRTTDALALNATIGTLARLLAERGDTTDLDRRRARALGMLATPERAAALLAGRSGDPDRLKPVVRLYAHVNADRLGPDGVARLEGQGAVPVQALRALLADTVVRVTGVIDHRNTEPVDAYEIPERMREQIRLANPYDIFPWGTRSSRHTDLDHTIPWADGGPTSPANLGPVNRTAHRAKTHAGWRCRQTKPGHWFWRSPLGRDYEVDNWGTHTPTPLPAIPSHLELDAIQRINATPQAVDADAPATRKRPQRRRRAGRRRLPRSQRSPRASSCRRRSLP